MTGLRCDCGMLVYIQYSPSPTVVALDLDADGGGEDAVAVLPTGHADLLEIGHVVVVGVA